jgi:hypothetical protein
MANFLFSRFNLTSFFRPKYLRLVSHKKVMFREEVGRLGLVADNKTNFAFRVFIVKSDEVCDFERSMTKNELTGRLLDSIKKDVGSIYTAVNERLEKVSEPNSTPTRLQIFFDKDDDFYSVVFGFKFKARNCINTEILRYIIPLGMSTYGRFMHVVAWNHHESNAAWDYAHVSDAPLKEFTPVEIVGFFEELAHLKDEVVQVAPGRQSKIVKVTRKRVFKPKQAVITPATSLGAKEGEDSNGENFDGEEVDSSLLKGGDN